MRPKNTMILRGLIWLGFLLFSVTAWAAPFSDDFNRNNLASAWTFIDPVGGASVNITDVGGDAHLELHVPEGLSRNPWDTNTAARVMQPADNNDLEIIVKFDSIPSQYIQMQGLLMEQDAANWLRFGNYYSNGSLFLYAVITDDGDSRSVLKLSTSLTGPALYLRVRRTGNQWAYSYSEDGNTWNVIGSFDALLNLDSVGIYAGNYPDGSAPAYTVCVDYFEVASDPLIAEDGAVAADTQAPLIHAGAYVFGPGSLTITWSTDEPAFGRVDYGTDSRYGKTQAEDNGLVHNHVLQLDDLVPGETYHFRMCAEDAEGRASCSDDVAAYYNDVGPTISLWYGDNQPFGTLGQPQRWINLLGNVSDDDGVASLSYRLNGGSAVELTIGPDDRRLVYAGDFNIDPAAADLQPGCNTIKVTAYDAIGNRSRVEFTLDYTPDTRWPLPYEIDWSTLSDDEEIQEVAQIVDGKWTLNGPGIRTAEPGYDRLIALGDRTWTNYEALVSLTLHEIFSHQFAIGLLFRWDGHTDEPVSCVQPKCGWEPLGDIGWLREDVMGFQEGEMQPVSSSWELETEYMLKMRVETSGLTTVYSLKIWPSSENEPTDWQMTRTTTDTPASGSLLLLAHWVDATFGKVSIASLDGEPADVLISKSQSAGEFVELNERFTYEINITNTFGESIDLMIADAMSAYVDYMDDSLKVYKDGVELTGLDDADLIVHDDASDQWVLDYTFGDITECLVISFDVRVENELANLGADIYNVATAEFFIEQFSYGRESNQVKTHISDQVNNQIPEPTALVLFSIGLAAILVFMRRRQRRRKN